MSYGKLIVVDGIAGAGKSTISQYISYLFSRNGIKNIWYHEEDRHHPIRWAGGGEFAAGDKNTDEGMELNIRDTLGRWHAFLSRIMSNDIVYIMEGCLYRNIFRYFLGGDGELRYPTDGIAAYYDTLMGMLKPADPCVIYLYRPDIAQNFEKIRRLRGRKFEAAITDGQIEAFVKRERAAQCIGGSLFEQYDGNKLSLDTTREDWNGYYNALCAHFGIDYYDWPQILVNGPQRYTGAFVCEDEREENGIIEILNESGHLVFNYLLFSNVIMRPVSEDAFELCAFPITLNYIFSGDDVLIAVSGSHLYDIVDKTLRRISKTP